MKVFNWDQEEKTPRKSVVYKEYLASPKWSETKRRIRHRNGGRCERCLTNEGQNLHHLTYETVGYERYQDIMLLCKGCHDRKHDVSLPDPLERSRFFMGGKIKTLRDDWRSSFLEKSLVTDSGGTEHVNGDHYTYHGKENTFRRNEEGVGSLIATAQNLRFTYTGPFFIEGCNHCANNNPSWNESGCGCDGRGYREVVSDCFVALHSSDALFAFISDPSAFGSFAELGWAYALNIPILIAYSSTELSSEMPFITRMALRATVNPDPVDAFITLCDGSPSKMIHGTTTFTYPQEDHDCNLIVPRNHPCFDPSCH
jgi:hypothetical protein